MPELKVAIDRDGCTSCGLCWSTCPDVFEQNQDDNHSQIKKDYRVNSSPDEGKIPESLGDCVKSAGDGCPVQVIHVK